VTLDDRAVTVVDVLDVKSWGLRLLAGSGGVDRVITWAHVFDVPDPSGWVDGGELVITTGSQFPAPAEEQVALLRRLHDRNAGALAVGLRVPDLTPELMAEADALAFPIIQIPRETGYLPIIKFVVAANGTAVQRTMVASLRIFETLAPSQEDLEPHLRYRQIERISGYTIYVVTDEGRALLEGMADLPAELIEHVGGTVAEPGRWASLAIPNGYASPLRVGNRRAGFLVAQESSARVPAGLSVFRSVETVARIDLSNLYRRREAARRRGSELLARYLHGVQSGSRPGAAARDEWGADLANGVVVIAIRVDGALPDGTYLDSELHHGLVDRGVRHLLLSENDRTIIAMGVDDIPVMDRMLRGLPVLAGASGARPSITDASVALREALWALRYGARRPGSRMSSFDGDGLTWTSWLPSDQAALAQLVRNTLGPIIDYDLSRESRLLQSLQVYFELDARLQAAAERLHVHKHTLAYRLKRIEELTGRDLNTLSDRAQLWMALAAYEVIRDA
jgi:purine catabolism regulator